MELALVNRGRYAMTHYPHLQEYRSDRHDADGLARLPEQEYDAAVDLCAYALGDVSFLLDHLPGSVKRYILISTADVYKRQPGLIPDETAPVQDAIGTGPAAEYIWNKVLLERELKEECAKRGIEPVILRPAFIYGPPSSTAPITTPPGSPGTSGRSSWATPCRCPRMRTGSSSSSM